jgi:hypothetical protein
VEEERRREEKMGSITSRTVADKMKKERGFPLGIASCGGPVRRVGGAIPITVIGQFEFHK